MQHQLLEKPDESFRFCPLAVGDQVVDDGRGPLEEVRVDRARLRCTRGAGTDRPQERDEILAGKPRQKLTPDGALEIAFWDGTVE